MADARSGVRLLGVTVERIRYDDTPSGGGVQRDCEIAWRIERRFSESSPDQAECAVAVLVRSMPEDPPFFLEISVVGHVREDAPNPAMPIEKFMHINAPAQLVPFARELVANISVRSKRGVIILPSVNLVQLVQEIETQAAAAVPAE